MKRASFRIVALSRFTHLGIPGCPSPCAPAFRFAKVTDQYEAVTCPDCRRIAAVWLQTGIGSWLRRVYTLNELRSFTSGNMEHRPQ